MTSSIFYNSAALPQTLPPRPLVFHPARVKLELRDPVHLESFFPFALIIWLSAAPCRQLGPESVFHFWYGEYQCGDAYSTAIRYSAVPIEQLHINAPSPLFQGRYCLPTTIVTSPTFPTPTARSPLTPKVISIRHLETVQCLLRSFQ